MKKSNFSTGNFIFYDLPPGLDIITILTIRYKIVRINHDGFRHRNKTGIRNQYDWSHRDFELL